MARSPLPTAGSDHAELAFALSHEVANLVGAVRMQAYLVDGQMKPRDLAQVSVEIDDLCARCAALLAHLRPLLDAPTAVLNPAAPQDLLSGLRDVMTHHGGRGTRLSFGMAEGLPRIEFEQEVLHYLLQSLLFAGIEATLGRGEVGFGIERGEGEVVFVVEDDGAVDEDPNAWRTQTARGRPLVCAIAHAILEKRGGRLEVARHDGRTRVSVRVPAHVEAG